MFAYSVQPLVVHILRNASKTADVLITVNIKSYSLLQPLCVSAFPRIIELRLRADDRLDFKPPRTELVMETSSHDDKRMQHHQAADRGAASVLPLSPLKVEEQSLGRCTIKKPQISNNGTCEFK